jgi:hypothetical protein
VIAKPPIGREDLIGIKRCGVTWPDVSLPRMSQTQRESIAAMLREVPLDAGGDLGVQRPLFEEFMRRQPLPTTSC